MRSAPAGLRHLGMTENATTSTSANGHRPLATGYSSHDRRLATALFLLVFVAYGWFYGGGGWNQNANFDLTRALVERQTIAIDAYRANTWDISFHGGRTYANKAPGISFLAVGPHAVARLLQNATDLNPDSFVATTIALYLCGLFVCGTSGALLAALFFLYGRAKGFGRAWSLTIALALAFGTYLFAYSTVFFSHVPSALFLFWAFARLSSAPDDRPWIAGALLGLAVFCNYSAILPLIVILAGAWSAPGPRAKRLAAIVAGGAPFAAALLGYQLVAFGALFRTSVEATSEIFQTQGAAMGVFVAPKVSVVYAILVSRYRGLFALSPFLVFAFAGFVIGFRERVMRREMAIVAGVTATLVLLNASFNNWHGGSAIGPRYILPAVPFLAAALLLAERLFPALRNAIIAISVAFNFAVAAVNPMPSRLVSDPIFRYTLPLLFTGRLPSDVPPHPPHAWKLMLGHVSVNRVPADDFVPFRRYPSGTQQSEWASFNLGETFAPGSPASLVPIALWIAGGWWLLVRRAAQLDAAEVD